MPAGEGNRGFAVSELDNYSPQDFAGLVAEIVVGRLQDKADRKPKPRVPIEACHVIQFGGAITLTAGAGTLQQADLFGPKDGYWWDLRSLEAWGFTAGTVSVFRNNPSGEQVASFPTAGENTWSAQKWLPPRDTLIFSAAGITGTVTIYGWAVEVATPWLADYLV